MKNLVVLWRTLYNFMKTFEEITTSVVETVSSLSYKKLNCDYFSKSIVVYT